VSATWSAAGWRLVGRPELFEPLRATLEEARDGARIESGPRTVGAWRTYFKGSPLRGRAALRHGARELLGLAPPRLAEFSNLTWLRARGFRAAHPLLAGVHGTAARLRYQFLLTELVPGARTLAEAFPDTPEATRAVWLRALATDLARLHGLGFVHRDLFPRNLLAPEGEDPRCTFLDAWRGGPRPGLRGPDHDLGCLLLDGAALFTRAEQALLLRTYREERERGGCPPRPAWPRRVERARAGVHAREARRRPGLPAVWTFPAEARAPTDGV